MNTPFTFWRYDLFKLVVALILLMLIFMFLPGQPVTGIDPAENDNVSESPLVPSTSEEQSTSSSEESEERIPILPAFPEVSVDLVLDDSGQYLLDPVGSPVYALDQEYQTWIPVIPEEIKSESAPGQFLGETDSGGWIIQGEDGGVLYAWDPEKLSWITAHSPELASNVDCPAASQPRLQIGSKARVKKNLNMRTSPGIQNNWMLTNVSGTELRILSGPVCTANETGSFLWWQVENPAGLNGWSAEAQQQGYYYFLEPITP